MLLLQGPGILNLSDRSLFRQSNVRYKLDFDRTLGYPGEGPSVWIHVLFVLIAASIFYCLLHFRFATSRRWNLNTRRKLSVLRPACVFLRPSLLFLPSGWVLGGLTAASCFDGAMAMPLTAKTPGELRKAAERSTRPPLQGGRPVTAATTAARDRFWNSFVVWTEELGVDLKSLLEHPNFHLEEINGLLSHYGRELYKAGKTYNVYAETINALGVRKPGLRRLLQQAWDVGYSWVKPEPSVHHIAMPIPILLSMLATAMMWGWTRVAAIIALGFGALLRPGEITGPFRKDLMLPSDVDDTIGYALLSIREPKSRYTYARHQTAKLDSSDLLRVVMLGLKKLPDSARLWNYSPQTLRQRFKTLLVALGLPSESSLAERALDLGSLRAGGATFIIQSVEDSELCRRRGRWSSMKMMGIYVQETMALQYMRLIPTATKDKIMQLARALLPVLHRAELYDAAGIPPTSWFFLFAQGKTA